jgi:hypothetical protein
MHASFSNGLSRQGRGVPVYTFQATLYCMYIKYISSTSAAVQEIAVVLMGPLSNILVFLGAPHTPGRQQNKICLGTFPHAHILLFACSPDASGVGHGQVRGPDP